MARYYSLLKSRPVPLENNYRQRQNDLITRFKTGTLQALCEIVRDLRARKTLRVLSEFDSTLLTRASDYLFDEWAAINEISRYEASQDVEALLVEGQSYI
jgi:RNA polymerase-interacting CarD/CdnL/TRCF family regulator